MATTPFQDFVNLELPKRISTNDNPLSVEQGQIPVSTGVGLGTTFKNPNEVVGSGNTTLFTAKRIPVRDDGSAILPNHPIGDFLYDTAIIHLTGGMIVEFIDLTLLVEDDSSVVKLPTTDYENFKNDIESITLSYLTVI